MKKWLFFFAALLLFTTGASTFLYAQNSYNQNPENQNVSQPGYQNGYNVSQSPYRSSLASNANSSSNGLSSFMRDSAGSGNLTKYLSNGVNSTADNKYQSYTQRLQTLTNTPQAKAGVSSNPNSGMNNGIQNHLNNSNLQANTTAGADSSEIYRSLANITERLNMLQQKLETGVYNNNPAPSNNMQRYMANSRANEITSTSELYSGIDNNSSGGYLGNNINQNQYLSGINSASAGINQQQNQTNNFTGIERQQPADDSLDQIKKKLDELSRSINANVQANHGDTNQYEAANSSPRMEEPYMNFQSYCQSQFDNYFKTAQAQLSFGNYNEAADSFMLASIYEPDNPLCYAGQGHALFAAGQYVNSALFIIRAIELNPDYIQANIDFVTIIGGQNTAAGRIAELEQLLKKAPASGLQFLMAYVYYRTGRLPEARQIINAVYQEMSRSRAAVALKIAIDTKLNNSN
jgi:hypothetical protein